MSKTFVIDPVTRIEGHAKVFLDVGDDGKLIDGGLVVNELRGFERILVGVEADRVPLITARICGVCPSAHHLAASKALDAAAGVVPPPAAVLLRELLFMGHMIHSHVLSLFVLSGPDLVLGLDSNPATRNIVGVVKAVPEIAKKALQLRTIGQRINEMIGGRGIHPVTSVAGGISFKLDQEKHATLVNWTDEALSLACELLPIIKSLFRKLLEANPAILATWTFPTWYMGTVKNGKLSYCDGNLRIIDENGNIKREFSALEYSDFIVESALDWSYMKPVYFKNGEISQSYRVGTLARINCADSFDTPLAEHELTEFRAEFGRPAHCSVMQIFARAIELIYSCENAKRIVANPAIWGETRVPVKFRGSRGVGHVEAPRGTLIHDYEIDEDGIVRSANLIVATQQNYSAINRGIMQAASSHVIGKNDKEALNAVEFSIRCFDPCLSCATHAAGQMPLIIEVRHNGETIRQIRRNADAAS
ncbi:MAG: Ni/Fe hydrogenase subunit alpha [bacterium]|nr:Ni/Fe hydrogenase subunit alpha [bacterium]